jgi:DNA-binding SARP family transcriptional activator
MEIALLGPLAVRIDDRIVAPTAAKPRQILALLALNAGRVVTVRTFIEEVWGEGPPCSATTTMQTYILQLRRMIDRALPRDPALGAKDVLVTRHGGYSLEVAPDDVDVHQFDVLTRTGRRAFDDGDDQTASTLLGRALTLWRGPALMDMQVGKVLELEVIALDAARLGVHELRIEADLRLGRHVELLGELGTLVSAHPMHEGFCAHFMVAFYRCGHPARALEMFQRLRAALVAELGIEPTPRLQRLQRAILTRDPALDRWGPPGRMCWVSCAAESSLSR